MVKWPKIWWNSKIQRDFTIPFLFHHGFSKHFIMLFPNPAVFFWILPFQASFTMLLLHISPWFILRCHFSLKPLWKTPPMTLFGNHFWSASPPLSPIIQGGYTREQLNFLHNPVIYETNWQSPTSSTWSMTYRRTVWDYHPNCVRVCSKREFISDPCHDVRRDHGYWDCFYKWIVKFVLTSTLYLHGLLQSVRDIYFLEKYKFLFSIIQYILQTQ